MMAEEQKSEIDVNRQMFVACLERDLPKLEAAIEAGADVFARQQSGTLDGGKSALHLAAKRGFVEGIVCLRAAGMDVDYPDVPVGNTALHILPDNGNADTFRLLVEMGADLKAKNSRGFDPAETALHMDRVRRQTKFGAIVEHFLDMPAREDMQELTLDDVLARDSKGRCMLDNPAMLKRMSEMGAALAANGTPLTKEVLQASSSDGRSYLEKLMICAGLRDAVAVLNVNGESLQHETLFEGKRQPSAVLEQMMKWRQVGAVFTEENWKDAGGAAMMHCYKTLPDAAKEQVPDVHQLRTQLDMAQSKGFGRHVR